MNIVKKRWKGLSFLVVVALLSIIVLADNLSLPVDDVSFLDNESNNSLDNTTEIPEDLLINETISILPVEPDETLIVEEPLINESLNEIPVIEEPSLISAVLTLIIDKVTAFIGDIVNIQAILTYENDTPIPDEKIDFYADEFIGSDITDVEGKAEIDWDTSSWLPDVYTVTAEYEGDEIISPVSTIVDVLIEEIKNETSFLINNLTQDVPVFIVENDEVLLQIQETDLILERDFSNLRPELVKNNNETYEIKDLLEEMGYRVRFVGFRFNENGFYVTTASIRTMSEFAVDDNMRLQEVLAVLYNTGFSDYYVVNIYDYAQDEVATYKVSRSILGEFLSGEISEEELSNDIDTQIEVLPPPVDSRFPNKR